MDFAYKWVSTERQDLRRQWRSAGRPCTGIYESAKHINCQLKQIYRFDT